MKSTKHFRGLWWNVWFDARDRQGGAHAIAKRVAALAREHDLDWICLQEVFNYTKYGSMGDLHDLILKATDWKGVFLPDRSYKYKATSAPGKFKYTQGMAVYSKWPIAEHRRHVLGTIHRHPSKGTSEKHLLEVEIETPEGRLVVANTHWTKMGFRLIKHRRIQMQNFLQHMKALSHIDFYVLGGDFNTFRRHKTIKKLRKLLHLHTGNHKQPTWRHLGKSFIHSNIDYVGVFKAGKMRVDSIDFLERSPSDHSPLLATFEKQ